MATKITPTGILVLSSEAPKSDWLAERRNGITATDIPAILGLNKYKTAIDVWTEKITQDPQNFEPAIGNMEAAFWGITLEDTVAKAWADQNKVSIRRIGLIRNETNSFAMASLDRLVSGCPDGRCGLEVKTRSVYVGTDWDQEVPQDVNAQVQWQLIVSGLSHIHVIALIGGQRLVEHKIELGHGGLVPADLISAASTVWQSVQSGQAPKLPETLWTTEYLDALHQDRTGQVEIENGQSLVADYQSINDQIKILEQQKDEIKLQLIGALGDAEIATADGRQIYTYKSQSSKRIDSKSLLELYPEASADDRIWNISNSRILRVSTKGKE